MFFSYKIWRKSRLGRTIKSQVPADDGRILPRLRISNKEGRWKHLKNGEDRGKFRDLLSRETFIIPSLRMEFVMRFVYFHFEWNKIVFYLTLGQVAGPETGGNYTQKILIKIEIFLKQRKVAFLSPSKICENLNFCTVHHEKFKFSQILLGDKNPTHLCSKIISFLPWRSLHFKIRYNSDKCNGPGQGAFGVKLF